MSRTEIQVNQPIGPLNKPIGNVILDPKHLPFADHSIEFATLPKTIYPRSEIKRVTRKDRVERQLLDETFKAREQLHKSEYPVLTAAVVGNHLINRPSITLSRAHRTMADAFAKAMAPDDNLLNVIDVNGYLPEEEYKKVFATGKKAQLAARWQILNMAHHVAAPVLRKIFNNEREVSRTVDFFMDKLVESPGRPVTTFHYTVGNTAIDYLLKRKISTVPIIHYITDPQYVHADYLKHKDVPFVNYFVFDERTKEILIEKGVDGNRVFNTGFPVDTRIQRYQNGEEMNGKYRELFNGRKANIAVFTGGLGQNQTEILSIARHLDYTRQRGIFYCGTNIDLRDRLVVELNKRGIVPQFAVPNNHLVDLNDQKHEAVIIIGDKVDNKLINLSYDALNAADVVCTKPSGDLGIESLIAGKPIIPLASWGKHEMIIKNILRSAGAIVNIESLSKIGKILPNDLLNAALAIFLRMRDNPPFPLDWERRVHEAFQKILKCQGGDLSRCCLRMK